MRKNWFIFVAAIVTAVLCTAAVIVVSVCNPNNTLSPKEIGQTETVNKRLEDMRNADEYIASDDTIQAKIALQEVNKLADEKYIEKGSINYNADEGMISYVLASGIFACEKVGGFDPDIDEFALVNQLSANPSQAIDSTVIKSKSETNDTIDGLVLFAMTDRQIQLNRCKELEKSWDSSGVQTKVDLTVTLDDLTSLKGYEFVYFKMHGIFCQWKYADNWIFGYESITTSWICLEQKQNAVFDKKYDEDLVNHRIGYINGQYMIAPDFFKAHYKNGDLDGDIYFLGCCELMGKDDNVNEAWTDALDSISLEAFIGMHNKNYSNYNLDLVDILMNKLIEGNTVQTAFNASIEMCGKNDETWFGLCEEGHPPAYPLLRGNKNATLQGIVETTETSEIAETAEATETNNDSIFSELSDITFIFSSGAGAWHTEVQIKPDGTFIGYYQDSNMGESGTDYPNGTSYECHFSGKFSNAKKINDYEYSMRIVSLNAEGVVGEEKIVDGVKIVTSDPYGFDNADEFILYRPGRSTADLPEEFLGWVGLKNVLYYGELPEKVPFYSLYNVGGKEGFFSDENNQSSTAEEYTNTTEEDIFEVPEDVGDPVNSAEMYSSYATMVSFDPNTGWAEFDYFQLLFGEDAIAWLMESKGYTHEEAFNSDWPCKGLVKNINPQLRTIDLHNVDLKLVYYPINDIAELPQGSSEQDVWCTSIEVDFPLVMKAFYKDPDILTNFRYYINVDENGLPISVEQQYTE